MLSGLLGLLLVRRFVWEPAVLAWDSADGEGERVVAWGREGFWLSFGLLAIGAMLAEGFLLLVRSAAAAGVGVLRALADPASMGAFLNETGFGQAVQWRALLLFVLFGLATWQYLDEMRPGRVPPPPGGRRLPWALMALAALAVFAGLAAGAHPALAPFAPLQIAMHTLHASAAALWTAGLAVIAWTAWRVPRLAPESGPTLASGLLARWGAIAAGAVGLLIVTGVVRVAGQLSSPAQLWEIDYGRVVLIKVALLVIAGGIALGNRRLARAITGHEAPPRRALQSLALRAGAEIGVLLLAFVVVAILVVQAPGRI
jgi:putative copper export protein